MKLFVHAKPKSKDERVEQIDDTHFIVRVKEAPEGGKANEAVVRVLARHLDVAQSRLSLVRGGSGKQKVLELD